MKAAPRSFHLLQVYRTTKPSTARRMRYQQTVKPINQLLRGVFTFANHALNKSETGWSMFSTLQTISDGSYNQLEGCHTKRNKSKRAFRRSASLESSDEVVHCLVLACLLLHHGGREVPPVPATNTATVPARTPPSSRFRRFGFLLEDLAEASILLGLQLGHLEVVQSHLEGCRVPGVVGLVRGVRRRCSIAPVKGGGERGYMTREGTG